MFPNDINHLQRLDTFNMGPAKTPGKIRSSIAHVFFDDTGKPIAVYLIGAKYPDGKVVMTELTRVIHDKNGKEGETDKVPAGFWSAVGYLDFIDALRKGMLPDAHTESKNTTETGG